MTGLIPALCAAGAVICVYFAWQSLKLQPTIVKPAATSSMSSWVRGVKRSTWLMAGAGLVAGLAGWAMTGWPALLIIGPAAVSGFPALLRSSSNTDMTIRLEALEEWIRNVSSMLAAGRGLEPALRASVRSAPPAIETEINLLVRRINAGVSTIDALRAFADDIDDFDNDAIGLALAQGAQDRSAGLTDMMNGLATTTAEQIRNRRAIEADRAKTRTVARWITISTAAVLTLLLLGSSMLDAYSSLSGQLILLALLSCYVGCLVWMRRASTSKPLARVFGRRA